MKLKLFLILAMSMPLFAQTATFTTQGGGGYPLHYNVVTEDGSPASGTVEISQDYGYTQSGIVLPYNPTAPGEYLNPIIRILTSTFVYGTSNGIPTQTVTYTFNSTENMYGYTWSGTFTVTANCSRYYRGRCVSYGYIQGGSGTMTAMAVN